MTRLRKFGEARRNLSRPACAADRPFDEDDKIKLVSEAHDAPTEEIVIFRGRRSADHALVDHQQDSRP